MDLRQIIQNLEDENFKETLFKKWIRQLNIVESVHLDFKGDLFKVKTACPIVLPYYTYLSIWADRYGNNWYIVHSGSDTIVDDLKAYVVANPDYAYVTSKSWIKQSKTCVSIRLKPLECIGECFYFDNLCPYTFDCPFGKKVAK